MEFDELLITTGVDALVRLVKEKQRIELPAASKLLGIPETTLEEWARILEEEKLLRIEYKLAKMFLVWVPPREEEIAQERASFYEEKKGLQEEVAQVRERLKPEVAEMEEMHQAFSSIYEKLAPKLDALEKATAGIELGRLPSGRLADRAALGEFRDQLEGVRTDIRALRSEWKGLEGRIKSAATLPPAKKPPVIEESLKALSDLEKRVEMLKKGVPAELPLSRDLDKKIGELKQDFRTIQSREAKIREELQSASETREIVQEMSGQLERYESAMSGMRNELKEMAEQAQALQQQAERFSKKTKEEKEAIERFGDSLTTAKDILSRYPAQPKILQELESMREREKSISDKMEAVEKLLAQLGSPKQVVDQFVGLQKRIREERAALEEGASAFRGALEEQKSLFATYEKIRDRTQQAISEYTGRLAVLDKKLDEVVAQGEKSKAQLDAQSATWAQRMKDKGFQEMVKALEDLRDRKQLIEQVKQALDESYSEAENLNRRLNLLAQQAKLIEIRSGAPGPGGAGASEGGGALVVPTERARAEEGVRNQLVLTQQEEEEFKRKRVELRELIQKLWEQS